MCQCKGEDHPSISTESDVLAKIYLFFTDSIIKGITTAGIEAVKVCYKDIDTLLETVNGYLCCIWHTCDRTDWNRQVPGDNLNDSIHFIRDCKGK